MSEIATQKITDVTGLVKWFDPKKGYGFIIGPEGQDIFAHFSKIQGDGLKVLKDGSSVAYDAELTDKGWHATRVVRTESLDVVVPKRTYSRSPRR